MGNLNPYYNESFVFLVEQEQLRVKIIADFLLILWDDQSYRWKNGDFTWQNSKIV